MKRVIVIGGGLGGLSIGSMLSHAGFDVLLLERSANLGGRAGVTEIDGFRVDHGIHASLFSDKSAAKDVLGEIGYGFGARRGSVIFYEDGKFRKLIGRDAILSPREKFKLFRHFLRARFRDVGSLYPMSVQAWLDQAGATEGIRSFLTGLCIAIMASTSLKRLSIGELVQFVKTAVRKRRTFGYPIGGWNSVLGPMVRVVRERGQVRTGCEVDEILVDGGRAIGVRTGGEETRSDFVVCAVRAQRLPSLVGKGSLPRNFLQRLKGMRETAGVVIDFGLSKRVSDLREIVITLDPPTLGWFTSNLEPALAPPGKQLLTTFSPIEAEEMRERKRVPKRLRELEEEYSSIFPEIADCTLWKREFQTVVNGAELNVDQTRDKRPSVQTPLENLFLVGDTTNAEGAGGEMAFNSAKLCFNILRGTFPIR